METYFVLVMQALCVTLSLKWMVRTIAVFQLSFLAKGELGVKHRVVLFIRYELE